MLPNWESEALERFPDLIDRFGYVDSVHQLWFELTRIFRDAYQPPANEELISRIYSCADWCCSQSRGGTAEDDLTTCVATCFYEHIPEIPAAVDDMPRWFSRAEVERMKDVFSYHVGEEGFRRILHAYQRGPVS